MLGAAFRQRDRKKVVYLATKKARKYARSAKRARTQRGKVRKS